ncbi:hypothetical protein Q7C_1064 [Methylophaga frappieri]|uniref:Alginate export domain-containing protein n=1 Tax=Methylophaga frappieri (strain ATCC BAA-2434 / DSM 25690 / JAM7) TaxID=754477 RepID=I1YH28_METFJ|nr:hypothetical protein [Methylophaga frappieri]AFJ02221.1 hypothetical protein Q7C_1064 [Methylophaga frappieri]
MSSSLLRHLFGALILSGSSFLIAPVQAETTFLEALTTGKFNFSARARYESVDQDNTLEQADAFTLRTTLGYQTAQFKGFAAYLELEDVSHIGGEQFNSTSNGKTGYSVIADPDGTELNQGYVSFQAMETLFKYGRQNITYRDAPFHRFVGNVLWRQNHQTFDAFTLQNTSLPDTTLHYGYIHNVNTINGEDFDGGITKNGNIDLHGHLINLQYTGWSVAKLEGYGYFLDYQDVESRSSKTLGVRLSGSRPLSESLSLVYTLEYASQDGFRGGNMARQNYGLAELGGKYQGWLVKLSHEVQQGDGQFSFTTPLGTNHAFQGWADQFLTTPVQGLKDTYVTLAGSVLGAKLVMVYHDFETDFASLDAGNELNVLLEKTIASHYTIGLKYADYRADKTFASRVDTEKIWLYGMVKF